ncbi:MAG: LuxR C-terminal-related transcriptional regulator [Planctomycetota bacterium]
MGQNLILVCLSRAFSDAKWALNSEVNILGCSIGCDIFVPEHSISLRHALISVTDRVKITDLGSRNGTFADGMPFESMSVRLDQTLRFGAIEFRLVDVKNRKEEMTSEDSAVGSSAATGASSANLIHGTLSTAQRRVFELLIKGLKEDAVAARLHLSAHTVHTHTREIYRIVGVHSRAELLSRLIS